MMLNDIPSNFLGLPIPQFASRSMSSSTANAGELTGAGIVIAANVGSTPGTLTTRTPALMIADSNLVVGQTWWLLLCNFQGTGVLTLGAGVGATVSGTATVAINTARLFTCVVASLTSIVFTGQAFGWTGNV